MNPELLGTKQQGEKDVLPDQSEPTIRRVAFRSMGFQGSATVVVQIAQAAVTLAFAAIATPREFALWGVAAVLLNTQQLIGSIGLGPALIYHHPGESNREAIDTVFVVTGLIAVGGFGALFFGASIVADLFGPSFDRGEVVALSRLVACAFAMAASAGLPQALIESKLRFGTRAAIDGGGAVAYVVLSTLFLARGIGVWGLLIGRLAQSAVQAGGSWLASPAWPRLPPRMRWATAGRLLSYGKWLVLAALLAYVVGNADNVAAGRLFGAAALGAYALAYTITNLVPTFVSLTVGKVFFPLFARVRNDKQAVGSALESGVQLVGLLLLPTTLALMVYAPSALPALFGQKWTPAGALLPILAVYGIARAAGMLASTFLAATGKPREPLLMAAGAIVVALVGLVPFSGLGVVGVALAFTLGQASSAAWGWWRMRDYWGLYLLLPLRPVAGASALALVTALIVTRSVEAAWSGVIGLGVLGIVYALLVPVLDPGLRRSLVAVFWRARP